MCAQGGPDALEAHGEATLPARGLGDPPPPIFIHVLEVNVGTKSDYTIITIFSWMSGPHFILTLIIDDGCEFFLQVQNVPSAVDSRTSLGRLGF